MNSVAQIGETVRQLRVNKNISQIVLAEQIGWHQPAISIFEQGKRKSLDVKDLRAIAEVLEVKPEDLLYNSPEKEKLFTTQDSLTTPPIPIIKQLTHLSPLKQEKLWNIVAEIIELM